MTNFPDPNQRLASISTMWTVLREAHGEGATLATDAQRILLERYGGAIYRYLLAAVHDPDVAEELTQEFAYRLVKGDFKQVDPERGRFRSYLKTVLFRMVSEHRKRDARQLAAPLLEDQAVDTSDNAAQQADQKWFESWRDELLARAWQLLSETHSVYYTVLRLKSENPKLTSDELSQQAAEQTQQPMSPENYRKILSRAREQFANHLMDEVAGSLDQPTAESIEAELIDLKLLAYCKK